MKPLGKKNRYNSLQEVSLDSAIQARSDILWREVDGEAVLLDPVRGHYYGLEGSGSRVWQLLQERTTLGDIFVDLLREYDVEEERLHQDLVEIYQSLKEFGLLKKR